MVTPLRQAVGNARKWHRVSAAANRPATGHQARPAWRALRFHIEVQKTHALLGKRVDAWSRRSPREATAIGVFHSKDKVANAASATVDWSEKG